MDLETKHKKIKEYLKELRYKVKVEKGIDLNDERLEKAINKYCSKEYDSVSFEKIKEEIDKELKQLIEWILKEKENYKEKKFKELKELYEKNKEKYKTKEYKVLNILEKKIAFSYFETKEVELLTSNGEKVKGFYKDNNSPNEYELLASRLGKIMGIPVCEYSLDITQNSINGISISSIPDSKDFELLMGYDFIKSDEVDKVINEFKNNKSLTLTKDETQYYIDMLLKGFEQKVVDKSELEQIKKDYFEAVLFNTILDQKDFHALNYGVLHDKTKDSYKFYPLFDNGNIKEDATYEGRIKTVFGPSKKEDIIDLLYTEYYPYVSDFSKKIELENNKRLNGQENMIDKIFTCIDDTLSSREASKYKKVVENNLTKVINREKTKHNVHDVYFEYPGNDRSKDIKGKVYFVEGNPEKGFNLGYAVFIPEGCEKDTTTLVHCCNTGGKGVVDGKVRQNIENRTAIHLSEAKEAARLSTLEISSGMIYANDLKMPMLMPLIPRMRGFYTQALGSLVYNNDVTNLINDNNLRSKEHKLSTKKIEQIKKECKDLPGQLTNMIKDSKNLFNSLGIKVDDKVIIEGYSAGSKFANCYTALHPEMVKACISGGNSGLGILPITELNGEKLNFPLGVNDVKNFNIEAFKNIPQLYYIGDKDFNDPAKLKEVNGKVEAAFKENYTNKELNIIHTMLGNNPQNRFDTNKKLYEKFGINAKFEKYNGDHNTVTMMRDEKGNFVVTNKIEGFVKSVLNKEKEQKNTKQNKNNFNQRTDKEKNIAKMIRQKNTKIRNDKKAKLKNPPMVRKPAPKKTQSSSTTKKGYTNTILLLLIVAFASGALFMALYTVLKNGLII